MTMSSYKMQREQDKFAETTDGKTSIRVSTIGDLLSGINYDSVKPTYPDTVTEIYSYYKGGLTGTLVATVTVVYTDASKAVLDSVVRT